MKSRKAKVVYEPHDGQKVFHQAFDEKDEEGKRRYKFFILLCGRRWGKDRASVNQFIKEFTRLDNRPPDPTRVPHTHGWVVAPTYPLAKQLWRELKAFWPEHLIRRIDNNQHVMETVRGGVIEVKSAHKPDDLVSVGLDILLTTEGARVPELAWQNMRPMLNSPGREGLAIINSTPKGMNWFGRAFWFGQESLPDGTPNPQRVPNWWSMSAPTLQNSYLSEEQREEIENARFELPEDIYAQEYEARILNNGATVFRGIAKVIQGMPLDGPKPGRRYVVGVDLGKLRDFTVITVMDRESKQVVHWERMNQMDWNIILDRVLTVGRTWRAVKMLVDQGGIGVPIVDFLAKKMRGNVVEGFDSNGNKKKIDLIQPLQVAIEREQVFFPNIKELVHELSVYEYVISDSGSWTMSAPSGNHDDAVISLALALRAADMRSMKLQAGLRGIYGRV